MKRHLLHLMTPLLAVFCLAATSCSDSEDSPTPPSPNFPDPVSATIEAGWTYTQQLAPNQNWEVSIPTELAAWFWMEDDTQRVWTKRGNAGGTVEIIIRASELEEYDDTRICKVTMTMGGQSKVIATITRGTLGRGIGVYASQIDDDGSFLFDPNSAETGLTYLYETETATDVGLIWPYGQSGFSMPILVEANYDWAISKMPDWISNPTITIGKAGTKTEVRLIGNVEAYPLDGAHDKLVFIDRRNPEVVFEVPVSIPACRNIFEVTIDGEIKFNSKGEYYNVMNGGWTAGTIRGQIKGIKGARFYKIVEITDRWGNTRLSADEADTNWITLTEDAWEDNAVIAERNFRIGAIANTGDARKARIIALPASLAVEDPYELFDMDIREEYQPYVCTSITQEAAPGPIQALTPEKMLEIGAKMEKLPSSDWFLSNFGVADGYKLIYTKQWSNDPESTLATERAYTGYKCYDYDLNEMTPANSWLSVRKTSDGFVVDMDPSLDPTGESSMNAEGIAHIGFIVFSDGNGDFALIQCIYDENYPLDDDKPFEVKFAMPDFVNGAELVHVTKENYVEIAGGNSSREQFFAEQLGMGVPLYQLTYTQAQPANAALEVSVYQQIQIMPYSGAEWLNYEPQSETRLQILMDKPTTEQAQEAMIQFLDSSWGIKAIVYCIPAF